MASIPCGLIGLTRTLALEWSRYHERGYQATNVGVRIALGSPRWFLRVGNNHAEGESRPYIGIAYNGF